MLFIMHHVLGVILDSKLFERGYESVRPPIVHTYERKGKKERQWEGIIRVLSTW